MRKLVTTVNSAIESIQVPPVPPEILGTKRGQRKGGKSNLDLQPPSEVAVDEGTNELGGGGQSEIISSDSNTLLAQVAGTGRATGGAEGVVVAKSSADAAAAGSILGGISTTTAAIVGGSAVVGIIVVATSGGESTPPQAPAPVNNAPTATNLSAAETYTEDTVLNLTALVASDVDSPNITATLTLSNAAAGSLSTATSGTMTSTYNASTGVWSASGAIADVNVLLAGVTFTPALNFNSNFSIATSVSDGVAPAITGVKAMIGSAVNDAPVAIADTLAATEDTAIIYTAVQLTGSDTDVEGNALTISSVTSGTGGTAVLNANGTVTFTPSANFSGAASFSYIASDGTANSNSATVTVNVAAVNDAPVATNLSAAETYTENTALNLADIVASDVDSSTITATLTLSNVAAGSLSTATSGAVTSTFAAGVWSASGAIADVNALLAVVTFTPALNFNSTFTIATSISDGVLAVTGNKAMTGSAVNNAPTATNLSAAETYTEDTALNLTALVASDVDSPNITATLTLSNAAAGSLSTATSGTMTSTYNASTGVWSASGAIADVNVLLAGVTFTPALNFNSNFSIATSVSDGVAPAITGVKAMIGSAVNDAPVAIADTLAATEDTAIIYTAVQLTGNDTDVENNALTISSVTSGTGGTAMLNANGTVTFTPTVNFNGAASFSYLASDGTANSNSATVTVNVAAAVNNAPALTAVDGKAIIQVGAAYDAATSVTLQTDGKILVAGRSDNSAGNNSDFSLIRMNTNGRLDTTFDGDGKAIISVGLGFDEARSMSLQADGKILLAGNSRDASGAFVFSLIRLNSDGGLDTTFDVDGKALIPIDTDARGYSMTLQADGRILVAGYSQRAQDTGYDFNLIRLNANGSLDDTFDNGGIAKIAGRPFTNDFATSVTLQADGKILVAGFSDTIILDVPPSGTTDNSVVNPDFALIRLNSDGSLDATFDVDGKAIIPVGDFFDNAYSMALQADGKILVAGFSYTDAGNINSDYSLIRLNADGSLDTTFDNDGKAIIPVGSGIDAATSMTLQADGKILVAGSSVNASGNTDFSLIRLNTNGSLDTTFDIDGKVIIPVGSANDAATSITLQADGKILVAGYAGYTINADGGTDYSLIRLNTDGSLDTSFGNSVSTPLAGVSATFVKNGTPVVLNGQASVFDADLAAQGNYGGASLTLARAGGAANAQDLFSASGTLATLTQGGILSVGGVTIGTVASNSGGTLTLNFDSNATQALVNGALQQIAYSNSSDAPPASVIIDWSFNDGNVAAQGTGGALVATGSTTVLITALNGPDQIITGSGGVDVLSGGFGNDTLTGYVGYDILTGGAGSDRFDYNSINDGTDTITDFTLGAGGDVLDLHDVLSSFTGITLNTHANAFDGGFLRFVASGADTLVQVDSDGVGGGNSYSSLVVLTNTLLLTTDTANYIL